MKTLRTLRAITLACALLLTSITAVAGEGVLTPGADKTPPPPPPTSTTSTTSANEDTGETDENLLLLYAAAIWLQLSGITILP